MNRYRESIADPETKKSTGVLELNRENSAFSKQQETYRKISLHESDSKLPSNILPNEISQNEFQKTAEPRMSLANDSVPPFSAPEHSKSLVQTSSDNKKSNSNSECAIKNTNNASDQSSKLHRPTTINLKKLFSIPLRNELQLKTSKFEKKRLLSNDIVYYSFHSRSDHSNINVEEELRLLNESNQNSDKKPTRSMAEPLRSAKGINAQTKNKRFSNIGTTHRSSFGLLKILTQDQFAQRNNEKRGSSNLSVRRDSLNVQNIKHRNSNETKTSFRADFQKLVFAGLNKIEAEIDFNKMPLFFNQKRQFDG